MNNLNSRLLSILAVIFIDDLLCLKPIFIRYKVDLYPIRSPIAMTTLHSTPRADGFHMPAEWAPQTQTWMIWPERPDNWRLGGKPAQAAHVAVAKAIARFEPVTVAVSAGQYENARARLDVPNIRVVEMSSDDAWVRDTGPTFVINNSGEVRGVNWDFNAWGGFEGGLYSPWNRDSQVGGKILEIERAPRYRTEGFVLEGGSIHVDGEGTLITTEECLLNRNRNPHLDRADRSGAARQPGCG
jgi:agmatine deiminase